MNGKKREKLSWDVGGEEISYSQLFTHNGETISLNDGKLQEFQDKFDQGEAMNFFSHSSRESSEEEI